MSSNNIIEKILSDAKQLNERLKARDTMADELIATTMNVQNRLKVMKQFRDLVDHLDQAARRRPRHQIVQYLAKESHKIKELEEENAELRQSLEEHQTTLEIIMSKYREQMDKLNSTFEMEAAYHKGCGDFPKKLQAKEEKIREMAAVMKVAADHWDEESSEEQKRRDLIETLRSRNQALRSILLDISPPLNKEEGCKGIQNGPGSSPSCAPDSPTGFYSNGEMAGTHPREDPPTLRAPRRGDLLIKCNSNSTLDSDQDTPNSSLSDLTV